ncbi:MAG: PVC-type heme-binding CxxCH protein, partial [Planctomycetaceae bacterium]
MPSMALLHDGWVYLPSVGHVIRRKQSKPDGPFDVQEEILRGLCGFHHHQASGLTISHDGWMFVTSGDDDNRPEGPDGSQATVLRTGAIFRCRPDGTQVTEFARGFRNPYRDVAFDHMYNMFHVDNDQEDGSKFQGVRLMHVLEGADYGWRLLPGAVCCRTDFARGAVFGEKPGKMPSMLKTGRGAPAGLLIYQGTKFPKFFRGLLIYADVYRKMVRAYSVERAGSTFRVTGQFTLMQSEDGLFRPCQALQGPDGAIYIVDWRTDSGGAGRLWGDTQHGRIYRLSWSGIEGHPAIPLDPMDAWAKIQEASDDELWQLLDGPDFEIRKRAMKELVQRGEKNRDKFIAFALDTAHTPEGRATAIGGACRFWSKNVIGALTKLLLDKNAEIRRLAATALNWNMGREDLGTDHTKKAIGALLWFSLRKDPHPAVVRAAALALGRIASLMPEGDEKRQAIAGFLLAELGGCDRNDVFLWDGILRG